MSSPQPCSLPQVARVPRLAVRISIALLALLLGSVTALAQTHPAVEQASGSQQTATTGIPFGPFHLPGSEFAPPYTGALRMVTPKDILPILDSARVRHVRIMLRLSAGKRWITRSDGTFDLAGWKQSVDRFRGIDLSSYIADGTIIGHYLVDEPHCASCWGRQKISYADIAEMARYSKSLWPGIATGVRVHPSWLEAGAPWTDLDFAWAQYSVRKGDDPARWIDKEVASARRQRLGFVAGLDVLVGGDGSSGIFTPGYSAGKWAMSASEVARFGAAVGANPYVCAFIPWRYDAAYFARADVRASLAQLGEQLKAHPATPCRQH